MDLLNYIKKFHIYYTIKLNHNNMKYGYNEEKVSSLEVMINLNKRQSFILNWSCNALCSLHEMKNNLSLILR